MKNQNKLSGKDLINLGIYGALYCVIMTAVAMVGFIPIMMVLLPILAPIICGIPMMLFMTKVKKFGMVTMMAVLIGVFLMLTGMGYWPLLLGLVCGLLADFICKSGNYQSAAKTVLANGVFHIMIFGNLIPLYIDVDGYFSTRQGFGTEYMESLTNLMQPWTAPALVAGAFLAGIVGALLGQRLLKKHFQKAGIV